MHHFIHLSYATEDINVYAKGIGAWCLEKGKGWNGKERQTTERYGKANDGKARHGAQERKGKVRTGKERQGRNLAIFGGSVS
jgi:hypothetical protein